jgi:tetratricopeptide (TPR) repeat protein
MLINRFKPVLLKRQSVAIGVWGEAGIGKSYQITELLRDLPCRNTSFHATTPLAALAKTLPRPEKLALWATRGLERLEQGEALETSTILDALGAVLAGLAPFVLHLEDLHEAVPERLEFIEALARMVRRIKGVGLIVTSRTEPPEPFVTIKLTPLPAESASLLLEQELTATLPEDASQWIYARACGNPLYTLEYLRYLTRQGFLWSDGKSWHWRKPEAQFMPATIEALIERLMGQAQSEPLHRYVLETKALLPIHASDVLWCKVARVSIQELATAVTALSHQGVFQENNFAHPLFREVTLKTMGIARKRDLSRRAIKALEDEPEQAALFVEEAELGPAQSLALLKKAAETSKERSEVEAARFLAKAVDYATGEEKGKLAFEAAFDLYEYDLREAIRLLELAHHTQPDDFEILARLAVYLAQAGEHSEVDQLLGEVPPSERTSTRGRLLAIGVAHYVQDRSRVVELWDAHPELHAAAPPFTVRDVAFSKADLGDAKGALELVSKVLGQAQLSAEERAILLETCGFACYAKSDFAAAVNHYTQAIDLFRENGQTLRTGSMLFNRAMALQSLARFSESLADAEASRQLAAEGGHALFYANAQLALAAVRLERGEYQLAEELFLECEAYYCQNDRTQWLVDVHLGLSELYRNWRPLYGVLARKHGEKALTLARSLTNPRYVASVMPYPVMAEALFGNPQRALELADEGYRLCDAQGDAVMLARILCARATALNSLGRSSEALSELQTAFDIVHKMNVPFDVMKIGLELDHLNNDVDSARQRLAWFEERGLMNAVNIAKRYFPELEQKPISQEVIEPSGKLEVLGSMQIFVNGKQETIRGRKRKELLACLLEARLAGRSQLSQLDLADKLHPDNPDENLETIKQLVHQVRSAFGQTVIVTSGNGYALGALKSDAEIFLENGDTTLWRGEYQGRDDLVSGALHQALSERVKALLETDPTEVARVGRMLVKAEPYELESWRLTLKAVQQSSTVQSVEKLYREGCKRMAEVGEVLPKSWEVFLSQSASVPT